MNRTSNRPFVQALGAFFVWMFGFGTMAQDKTEPGKGLQSDPVLGVVRTIMESFATDGYELVTPIRGWATGSGIIYGLKGEVTGKELMLQASTLIPYGHRAIPELLCWIRHPDPAVRYIAAHALDTITEEKSGFHYHPTTVKGDEAWLLKADEVWRERYAVPKGYEVPERLRAQRRDSLEAWLKTRTASPG